MTLPPHDLPPVAQAAFHELTEEQKRAFISRYGSARRSMPLMVALSILFPIQLLFLGKVLLGVLFLITGGGFGVWFVVEWFLTPGRVRDYNTKVASDILSDIGAGLRASAANEEE